MENLLSPSHGLPRKDKLLRDEVDFALRNPGIGVNEDRTHLSPPVRRQWPDPGNGKPLGLEDSDGDASPRAEPRAEEDVELAAMFSALAAHGFTITSQGSRSEPKIGSRQSRQFFIADQSKYSPGDLR
jgi:hypothetical protein